MNAVVLLVILVLLFVSLFVIIPTYAPASQVELIQDWVGLGINGLLFLIVLFESRFAYRNVYAGISFFVIAIVIAVSGVYGWIPRYIPASKQSDAIKYLFLSLSISIILVNTLSKAIPVTF